MSKPARRPEAQRGTPPDLFAPFAPWPEDRRVAVAVSGGADSLCLAWLAARWGKPTALIVDHGIRPESADEAALTAARCASFGVPSRILSLSIAPGPGLAARARHARYAALGTAAAELGLLDLLVGHHAHDQAETEQLRTLGASGPAGLAGMAAVVEIPALRIVRPLLGIEPAALRAILSAAGLSWIEDPSNRDMRALRPRLRASFTREDREAALTRAAAAALGRMRREIAVARELAERVSFHPEGYARITPGPIAPDTLGAVLRTIAGRLYPPASASLRALAADLRPATLAGARLLPAGRLGLGWLVVRETAAMAAAVAANDGAWWDRRFRLVGRVPPELTLGALAADAPKYRSRHLPAAVAETLPALRRGKVVVAVPPIGYAARSGGEPHVVFAPWLPAAGAGFARGPV